MYLQQKQKKVLANSVHNSGIVKLIGISSGSMRRAWGHVNSPFTSNFTRAKKTRIDDMQIYFFPTSLTT